jgi:hypothetical protein
VTVADFFIFNKRPLGENACPQRDRESPRQHGSLNGLLVFAAAVLTADGRRPIKLGQRRTFSGKVSGVSGVSGKWRHLTPHHPAVVEG